MYRLAGMTDSGSNTIVSNVSYDPANRLLTMNYPGANETRSYNVLGQLVNLAANGENLTYNYPTGTNNGKVSSMYNAVSGETVTYTYDTLNRMITANGSGWGEAYTFDPFGNLTTKTRHRGTGPSLSVIVNQSNNQITSVYGQGYDANGNTKDGNMTAYDAENHLIGAGWNNGAPAVDYAYDAQGKRFFMWTAGTLDSWGGNDTNYSVVMYSPSGQKLGTYLISVCNQGANNTTSLTICSALSTSDKYFGGRRLAVMDQLGSAGTYYPWGEAKGTTNPQDAWSYATYWRDSVSGLDYANQRYYSNTYGRFMTPDRSSASISATNPTSWNRYSYTKDDPVNGNDPSGLLTIILGGFNNGNPDWAQSGTDFNNSVSQTFGEQATVFAWSGYGVSAADAYAGIYAGGLGLADFINNYTFKPGEELNIIGFSEGGNVAKVAISLGLKHKVDNFVELGTPQNWDLPALNPLAVGNSCSVSSMADPVQVAGASPFQLVQLGESVNNVIQDELSAADALENGDYLGALQIEAGAVADAATVYAWYMSTKVDPFATNNVFLAGASHFDLHTVGVWNGITGTCGLHDD